MPDVAIVDSSDVCVFQGGILGEPVYGAGPQHHPTVPFVNNDPLHSHYAFVGENSINCLLAGELTVESNGGNDGHMIDLFDPATPIGGPNGDASEFDPADDCLPLLAEEDRPCPGNDPSKPSDGDDHDFDDHHGAVTESGWSHSSGYSGGDARPGGGRAGESNTCSDNANNQNKADISATTTAGTSIGWLKYIRVGVVVDVWGCLYAGPLAGVHFSAFLVWLANPSTPGAAFQLIGMGAFGTRWLTNLQPAT